MKIVVTVGYIDIKVIYVSHKCCVRKWTGIDGVNIGNYVSEYVSQIDLYPRFRIGSQYTEIERRGIYRRIAISSIIDPRKSYVKKIKIKIYEALVQNQEQMLNATPKRKIYLPLYSTTNMHILVFFCLCFHGKVVYLHCRTNIQRKR